MNKSKNTLTIEKLKCLNARYDINHFRVSKKFGAVLPLSYFKISGTQSDISAVGGMTMACVRLQNGTKYHAIARCTNGDNFRKRLGLSIVLKRIQERMDKDVPFLA